MRVDRGQCGSLRAVCRLLVLYRHVDHGADEYARIPACPARRRAPPRRPSRPRGSRRVARRGPPPRGPNCRYIGTRLHAGQSALRRHHGRFGRCRCSRCPAFDLPAKATAAGQGDASDVQSGSVAVSADGSETLANLLIGEILVLQRYISTFILKSCRNRAGNVELLGVAEGQLRDEEDLLEVETRCDHLLAEGGEIVLVSAADFLE